MAKGPENSMAWPGVPSSLSRGSLMMQNAQRCAELELELKRR